jgi:hypothetical protein
MPVVPIGSYGVSGGAGFLSALVFCCGGDRYTCPPQDFRNPWLKNPPKDVSRLVAALSDPKILWDTGYILLTVDLPQD